MFEVIKEFISIIEEEDKIIEIIDEENLTNDIKCWYGYEAKEYDELIERIPKDEITNVKIDEEFEDRLYITYNCRKMITLLVD